MEGLGVKVEGLGFTDSETPQLTEVRNYPGAPLWFLFGITL